MGLSYRTFVLTMSLAAAACLLPASVCAAPVNEADLIDRTEPLPKRLENVDIEEKLGQSLPMDAMLTDSSGKAVRLGDYFDGKHPVLLTFNYSDCPMLCSLQLNRMVGGLKKIDRTIGKDFSVITISIDPKETPQRARETKERYLGAYGRPEGARGWHFLTAPEEVSRAIADSVGFHYAFNEVRKEWLHTAAVMVLTPSGVVARYLYGINYHPNTLDLSVVEASEGKIASTLDRLILYCFHYDATEGRYAPVAMNIMRVGGGLVASALAAFMAFYWTGELRKKKMRASSLAPVTAS